MSYDLRFVDSISATPSVRLDLMAAPFAVQTGTEFGMPELRRAAAGTLLVDGEQYPAAAYSNRALTLVVRVTGAEDATAAALQQLYRELNRASNVLEYRPATSAPVFFRTFRAGPDSVQWDPFVREARVVIPAEPFAYGLRETLPAVTVYNDPAEGSTLNANPNFTTDASGWAGVEGSITWSTTFAHEGTASLLITPSGTGANPRAESTAVEVVAGVSYRVSAWVRCAVARNVDVNIAWFTAAGTFISNSINTVAVAAGTWTYATADFTAPGSAGRASVQVRMTGTPPASNLLYVDEARLRQVGGVGGASFEVLSVKGDVETPLFLRMGDNVIGSIYDYRNVVMGVRRRGTPGQAPMLLQAEAMTVGTNTALGAANDPLMSGAGQNYMRISPAGALMEQRLYMPLWPTAATPDARGRYRVLARMRISAVSDVWSVQFAYGANATLPIRNDAVRVTQTAEIAYYDLGTIQLPVGSDPVTDGYSGTETPVAGTRIAVWAQRAAGTGTLDIDLLLFVPADDRYSVARVWSDTGASAGIIDGARHMVYAVGGSGEVRMPAQPDAPVGGLPMLSPGVANRIVWLVDGGSPRDILSSVSTLTPYYWPRFLYARPPS